jgi:ankyrin repeat protein
MFIFYVHNQQQEEFKDMPSTPPEKPPRGELLKALGVSDMKTVRVLLEQGADPNEKDHHGSTALHYMVTRQPFNEIATLLIEHGANVDAMAITGLTPLMQAVFRHNLPTLRFLIDHGASLRIRSHIGFTALDYAYLEYAPEVVKILEEALAQQKPPTIQEQLVAAIWDKDIGRLKTLLDQGAAADTRDISYFDETPLIHAIRMNSPEMTKLFLDYKADPNQRGALGYTALLYAASAGNLELAQMLLDHGADPDLKNTEGKTALMLAAQYSPAIVRLLLDKGADLTINHDTKVSNETRAVIEEATVQREIAAYHKTALRNQDALKKRRVKTVLSAGGKI